MGVDSLCWRFWTRPDFDFGDFGGVVLGSVNEEPTDPLPLLEGLTESRARCTKDEDLPTRCSKYYKSNINFGGWNKISEQKRYSFAHLENQLQGILKLLSVPCSKFRKWYGVATGVAKTKERTLGSYK